MDAAPHCPDRFGRPVPEDDAPAADRRRFTLWLVGILCAALGFLLGVGYALSAIGGSP